MSNFVYLKDNELVYLLAIGANLFAPFLSSISRACARFACVRADSRNILNILNLFVYNANYPYLCRNCEYMSDKIKWIFLGALLALVTWPFWFPFVVCVLGLLRL